MLCRFLHNGISFPQRFVLNLVVDQLTEWSMLPACPSLKCVFNGGDTGRTNSLKKIVFDVCVWFVLCKFVSGLILWFLGNLCLDERRVNRRQTEVCFSSDVILCG